MSRVVDIVAGVAVLVGIGAVLAFALACGGSSTPELAGGGISGTGGTSGLSKVSGAIDDAALAAKAGDALTGRAVDVDSGAVFPVYINGRTYATDVKAGGNVVVEIRNGDTLVLSRSLTGDETATFAVQADISMTTHLLSGMGRTLRARGADHRSAMQQANREVFGTPAPAAARLNLAGLVAVQGDLAAAVSVLQQVVSRSLGAPERLLIAELGVALESESVAAVLAAYAGRLDALVDAEAAAVFAASYDAARGAGVVPFASYQGLRLRLTGALVRQALAVYDRAPRFGAIVDTVRTATPGALFQYTFPEATPGDALGLAGYRGAFTTTPAGAFDTSGNGGRTLSFIPAAADAGATFTWRLEARGANGAADTLAIAVPVKAPAVAARGLVALGRTGANGGSYRPLLGPVQTGGHLYLVAAHGTAQQRLERYRLSEVASLAMAGGGNLTLETWALPTGSGNVLDLAVLGNQAHLATSAAGLVFMDVSGETLARSEPLFAADRIALLSGQVYGLRLADGLVMRSQQGLSQPTYYLSGAGSLGEKAAAIAALGIGTWGGNLFLHGERSLFFHDPRGAGVLGDVAVTSSALTVATDPAAVAGSPLWILSGSAARGYTLSGTGYAATAATGLALSGLQAATTNATCLFTVSGNGTVAGWGLAAASSNLAISDATGAALDVTNAARLHPVVVNVPAGLSSGNTGALLLVPGQWTASGNQASASEDNSWYFKVYSVQPQP